MKALERIFEPSIPRELVDQGGPGDLVPLWHAVKDFDCGLGIAAPHVAIDHHVPQMGGSFWHCVERLLRKVRASGLGIHVCEGGAGDDARWGGEAPLEGVGVEGGVEAERTTTRVTLLGGTRETSCRPHEAAPADAGGGEEERVVDDELRLVGEGETILNVSPSSVRLNMELK
ncbi:hypothetical protein QJS04_geneDACA009269 [Acorus gramineus]|uniref:Uncharacterized protein n=1 Tax=Acorus gramineus TaxID=55184 RepID=A0AAV9A2F3_ACOGR|nr:hypothetical protein QJS04_geneDACA009269 [Acorus gramineus]